jgi:hypothetical protein
MSKRSQAEEDVSDGVWRGNVWSKRALVIWTEQRAIVTGEAVRRQAR